MTEARLPRLLDNNLLEIARLHPISLSIDLTLSPMSTASMVVSRDEAEISVGHFVELFTAQGSAGIFIVKGVDYDPDRRQQNIQLNHGIDTLSNNLMEGEEEKTGTATALLSALLDCQTRRLWTLGTVEVPDETTLRWECDYSNVLQSIVNLMEQLPTYALTMDQLGMPWVLGVEALREDDACECRLTRNLESLSINIDKTNLCTRLFIRGISKIEREESYIPDVQPDAEGNLPPLEDYKLPPQEEIVDVYSATLEADTIGVWGVVDRVLEADQELPRDELIRQGEIYLEERKNPEVTVTLDAYDLYQATGEPFDRFYLGRICRVCLPEYGAVIRHRVVGLTYTDAIKEPERVTVTLAAKRADGIDTITGIIVNTAMINDQVGRLQINKITANGWLEILSDWMRLHAKYIRLEADKIELIAKEILLQAEKIELQGKDILILGEKIELNAKEILAQGEKIELNAKDILLQAETIKMVADEVDINAENIRLWGDVVDEHENRLSQAEININAANALIELRTNQLTSSIDGLASRLSDAEIEINGAKAAIALKANQTTVDRLSERLSAAEILIDGANAAIALKANQEEVTELGERLSAAEILIDGANAAIALKANQEEVTELGKRLSAAEILIDGANARIDLKASLEEVNALEERMSYAEIAIDGANAKIALKAEQTIVDDIAFRLSSAEIAIDGANARIDLKASQVSLDELDNRVSSAEIEIDGANAQIALKASQTSVNALGTRVSSAEIAIDGLNSEIALKADTILLQGYVKASELETEVLEVVNASYIETLAAGFIASGDINAETINCDAVNTDSVDCDLLETETLWATGAHIASMTLDGAAVSSGNQMVVTSLNGLDKTYADIWYMDSDGSEQYIRVLTNVENRWPNQVTLKYLTNA